MAQNLIKIADFSNPSEFSNTGYNFLGWSTDPHATQSTCNDGAPYTYSKDSDANLYAIWGANTDTTYTIKRYFQNLDGTYGDPVIGTGSGTTGAKTSTAENHAGFTAQSYEEQTIKGDGTTVVEIRYYRDSYDLTVDYVDTTGTLSADQLPKTVTIKLLFGTHYSVSGTGAVKYRVYSNATNYKTVTLAPSS